MSLPFDLEDVFGVAVVDLLKRSLTLVASLYWGWMQAILAFLLTGICHDLVQGWFSFERLGDYLAEEDFAYGLILGWLAPVFTSWILFYLVSLLCFLFYLFKSECSMRWAFVTGVSIVGVFTLLAMEVYEDWWGLLTLAFWLAILGAVVFLATIWGNRIRQNAEMHLLAVAAENERKRVEREEAERRKYRD